MTIAKLTKSAQDSLIAAARLAGEPEEPFNATDLALFEERGSNGYAKPKRRSPRGLLGHTLPALERRGYVARYPANNDWKLTQAGFDEAYRLCGGRGLM